jgi:hypothetical protein
VHTPDLAFCPVALEASRPDTVRYLPQQLFNSFYCWWAQTRLTHLRWSSDGDPSLNLATAGPLAGGLRGVPLSGGSHSSFEIGSSDVTSLLVIGCWSSMGSPTTLRDYRLISAAMEVTELIVGKVANRIRAVPIHSFPSSGNLRLSPSGRWREKRPALSRFAPSPTIIQIFPLRLSSDARHAASYQFRWGSWFELRECRPSGRWREKSITLRQTHTSFECGNSKAPSRLVIGGRLSMENPTTWPNCSLSSPAFDRTELIVKKCANRIRAFHFQSIRSSGTRRISPSGRCRERRPPCVGSFRPPTSIQLVPLRANTDARQCASLYFIWRSFFELRDCRTSGRWLSSFTTLTMIAPFVRKRKLRRPVTPRHRISVLHGKPK